MFKIRGLNPAAKKTSLQIIKIQHLLTKAIGQIKYPPHSLDCSDFSGKRGSEESSQPESIAEVLVRLQKGYRVLKHSPNTQEPHVKWVYLSDDYRHLCWKSEDRQDEKRLQVSSIARIARWGCKSVTREDARVNFPENCLIIVSTVRHLELQTSSEDTELLWYDLDRLVKYSRRMSQNYKYSLA